MLGLVLESIGADQIFVLLESDQMVKNFLQLNLLD